MRYGNIGVNGCSDSGCVGSGERLAAVGSCWSSRRRAVCMVRGGGGWHLSGSRRYIGRDYPSHCLPPPVVV